MQKHLDNCTEYEKTKRPRDEADVNEGNAAKKQTTNQYWDNFTVKTSRDEVRDLGLQLTRAIISSNSPFSLVEDAEFKKYHNQMRPGMPLPSRHTVGGEYLDVIYQQEVGKAKSSLSGQYK